MRKQDESKKDTGLWHWETRIMMWCWQSQWITEAEPVSGGVNVVLWNLALLTIPSLGFLPGFSFSFASSSFVLPSQFPSWSPFCIYLFLHLILPWIDSFTSGALTDKYCWLTNLSGQHVCLLNPRPRFPISCGYLALQSLSMCPKLVLLPSYSFSALFIPFVTYSLSLHKSLQIISKIYLLTQARKQDTFPYFSLNQQLYPLFNARSCQVNLLNGVCIDPLLCNSLNYTSQRFIFSLTWPITVVCNCLSPGPVLSSFYYLSPTCSQSDCLQYDSDHFLPLGGKGKNSLHSSEASHFPPLSSN